MLLSDLLGEAFEVEDTDWWDQERTANPPVGVRRPPALAGLSLRETVAILDLLNVDRSHGAVWNWTHRLAENQTDPPRSTLRRVAVDETAIQVGMEGWCYTAIDLER